MTDTHHQLWTPFFLRREVLLVFLLVHLAVIAALAALFRYSNTHLGFTPAEAKYYLLWQYGPTAVFTIVAAFWGQVEYRTKQLAPWRLMSQQSRPVDQSLLLDFVSPISITSFLSSMKSPDTHAVTAAAGGAFLIKLITILSTGLFVLQETVIESPAETIVASKSFGGANTTNFDYNNVDRQAFSRLYGINNFSLPYPAGTTSTYAYQNFNTSQYLVPEASVNITGHVNVFHSGLECEVLSLKHASCTSLGTDLSLDLNLTSETCGDLAQFAFSSGDYFSEWGLFEPANMHCKDNDTRVLMSFGTTTVTNSSDNIPLDAINSSHVLCRPSYGISPGVVVLNANHSVVATPNITLASDDDPLRFPGVATYDLLATISDGWMGFGTSGSIQYMADYFLLFMPNVTRESLTTNPDLLARGTDLFFQAFAAQLASLYFTEPANQTIPGSITRLEERLVLRAVTFGLMEGLLALLFALTLMLVLSAPRACVPQDPGTIEGTAAILARSPGVLSMLRDTGASDLKTVRKSLAGATYTTQPSLVAAENEFGITEVQDAAEIKRDQERELNPEQEDAGGRQIQWFSPLAVALPAKLTIVLAPVAMIIVLEALYQQGRKHDGVCELVPSDYIHYTYTYIPVVFLVSVGLMFGSLDFSAKIFQPHELLRRGGACSSRTLGEDYLGKTGLHCLWRAIRQKHAAVASSSFGMMVAPGLTIAASGLFFTRAFPRDYHVQVHQTSSFNYTFPSTSYGGGADPVGWDMANLLLLDNNLDYPLYTYDNLAFPSFDLSSLPNLPQAVIQKGSVATRVTAFRARSNCTSDSIFNITYTKSETEYPPTILKQVSFNYSLPAPCGPGGIGGATITAFNNATNNITDAGPNYIGQWVDLFPTQTSNNTAALRASGHGCPSQATLFGRVVDGAAQHLAPLLCAPYLETVAVDVLLNAADLSFNLTAAPPRVVEETAAPARNLSLLRDVGQQLYEGWALVDDVQGPWRMGDAVVDGFFAMLFHGPREDSSAAPAALLAADSDDDEHAALRAAIDRLYGRVVAQLLNTMRTPPSAPGGEEEEEEVPQPVAAPATLTVRDRLRLQQNGISTRILEAFLAALALCALLTYATLDTKKVLPKNPCSIAAVASLLAGAKMLERCYPAGSEWLSGPEKRERGLYEGLVFSLGWWPGGRFGIDVGFAEREGKGRGGGEDDEDEKEPRVQEVLQDGMIESEDERLRGET